MIFNTPRMNVPETDIKTQYNYIDQIVNINPFVTKSAENGEGMAEI